MGYVYKEYPKTLYRWGADGAREGKTFASAEDVEAGWVELQDLGAAPAGEAKPALSDKEAVAAGKRLVALERENAAMKDTIKLFEDEAAAKDKEIAALREAVKAGDALAEEAPARKSRKAKAK